VTKWSHVKPIRKGDQPGALWQRIRKVEPTEDRQPRSMWAFWIACFLLIIGGVAPILFGGGTSSRLSGVIIPFGIAAAAMGANALMYHQGRPLAAGLYFVAGISTVYGILSLLAVPLRLAVVGTCPAGVVTCPGGFEQQMTVGENTGLSVALALGLTSILIGFLGLLMFYRSLGVRRPSAPVRTWPDRPPSAEAAPAAAPVAKPDPEPEPKPEAKPEPALVAAGVSPHVDAAAEAEAELPAPVELPELEAPHEMLELPAPHDEPVMAAETAPPKPRARRVRKPKPPITSPDGEPPAAS